MSRWTVIYRVVLWAVVAAMAVELVLLVRQNRALKAELATAHAASAAGQPLAAGVTAGDVLPPVELPDLNGVPHRLDYGEDPRDSLLLIFSPTCPACRQNLPNWKQVAQRTDAASRRLVFISTAAADETRRYAESEGLSGEILLGDVRSLAGYRLTHVPTTLRVSADGVVEGVWVGVLAESVLRDL